MMAQGQMQIGPTNMGPGPGIIGPIQPVNPATNDAPLEFNTNKNKPPMAVSSSMYCIFLKNSNLFKL